MSTVINRSQSSRLENDTGGPYTYQCGTGYQGASLKCSPTSLERQKYVLVCRMGVRNGPVAGLGTKGGNGLRAGKQK